MVAGLVLLAIVVLLGIAALRRYAGGKMKEAATGSNVAPPVAASTPALPTEEHGPWGGRKDEPSGPWS